MGSNNPSSSSTTLRFLGLLKQPDASDPTNPDLHEDDVVWSFFPSSDTYPLSKSSSPSPPSIHNRRRFNAAQSGLSAALEDGQCHLINRRSMVIPMSSRTENIPVNFLQSAPVNIPMWPKAFLGSYNDGADLDEVEEADEEGEMVPPHVIVARSHVTLSVFEGAGRTLKGRDLRRVRNAVFQKTGKILGVYSGNVVVIMKEFGELLCPSMSRTSLADDANIQSLSDLKHYISGTLLFNAKSICSSFESSLTSIFQQVIFLCIGVLVGKALG